MFIYKTTMDQHQRLPPSIVKPGAEKLWPPFQDSLVASSALPAFKTPFSASASHSNKTH